MTVTEYVTRYVTRERREPYRPDPNLTGPTTTTWGDFSSCRLVRNGRTASDAMMRGALR